MNDAERRRRARSTWRLERRTLADERGSVLVAATPGERITMVNALTLDAWAMGGRPLPDYPRHAMPGRLIRPTR